MIITYFIPDDGDDFDHPNLFEINDSGNKVTLKIISDNFPLPGSFHFRFLTLIGGNKVWLDCTDPNVNVPLFNGSIFLKIGRVNGVHTTTNIVAERFKKPQLTQEDVSLRRNSEKLLKFDEFETPPADTIGSYYIF